MISFRSHLYVRRPPTYISSKLFLSPCRPGFDSLRHADATYEFLFLSHFINVIFSPLFSNIINALFFLARYTLASTLNIDLNSVLGLYYYNSPEFNPYQLISYMFMHGGFSHIFFNMFALWMFGTQIENLWGPKRFLNYYLITGFGAAFLHYLIIHFQISGLESYFTSNQISEIVNSGAFNPSSPLFSKARMLYGLHHTPVVGASGAVFGLLLAYGMTYPNQIIYLNLLFPIKAK